MGWDGTKDVQEPKAHDGHQRDPLSTWKLKLPYHLDWHQVDDDIENHCILLECVLMTWIRKLTVEDGRAAKVNMDVDTSAGNLRVPSLANGLTLEDRKQDDDDAPESTYAPNHVQRYLKLTDREDPVVQ